MRERFNSSITAKELSDKVESIYEEMRTEILDKILVRRTRKNLLNNKEYKEDLDRQKVKFPHIEQPQECIYEMEPELKTLFYHTMYMLMDTRSEENPEGKGYQRSERYEFFRALVVENQNKIQ